MLGPSPPQRGSTKAATAREEEHQWIVDMCLDDAILQDLFSITTPPPTMAEVGAVGRLHHYSQAVRHRHLQEAQAQVAALAGGQGTPGKPMIRASPPRDHAAALVLEEASARVRESLDALAHLHAVFTDTEEEEEEGAAGAGVGAATLFLEMQARGHLTPPDHALATALPAFMRGVDRLPRALEHVGAIRAELRALSATGTRAQLEEGRARQEEQVARIRGEIAALHEWKGEGLASG